MCSVAQIGVSNSISTCIIITLYYQISTREHPYPWVNPNLFRALPLFRTKSVHSLYILTTIIFNEFDIMYDEELMKRYSRASNIIDLAFDECQAKPRDIIPMPSIPKSLRSFCWVQNFSCFDRGSCKIPFYNILSESLSRHKEILENLDLDLPHPPCKTKRHGANPYVNPLDMLGLECGVPG
jgi:hypothetical protein